MPLRFAPPAALVRWRRRHPRLAVFAAGLAVRLVGLGLIWAGDGHASVFSKAVVVVGVALSVFGIGILKWLAMQPRRRWADDTSTPTPPIPPTTP